MIKCQMSFHRCVFALLTCGKNTTFKLESAGYFSSTSDPTLDNVSTGSKSLEIIF